MKILLFTDLHMCPRASIINKWGSKYPARLENCINSVNWIERLAKEYNCSFVINLGDFFDRPDLPSETITACNDICWSDIPHYSLVGNHDASVSSLVFNSANSLLGTNHKVITEPTILELSDCSICFLPYIVECDRKPLVEYFKTVNRSKPVIICSHNDISGIQLGPIMSKTGFSLDEIEANCDLFLNGHLHNGQALTEKVINLGNLTGKDFGEDASKYKHAAAILDTETLQLTFIENPFAYNFYKMQIDTIKDIDELRVLKSNAVVSIKCESSIAENVRNFITESCPQIVDSRIILIKRQEEATSEAEIDLSVDHLAKFIECCRASIEFSTLLEEELSEICK